MRTLAALFLAAVAYGDMLEYVTPRGGSIGTTVDVVLHGTYLTDPKEIVFYNACLRATDVAKGANPNTEVKARFTISPQCPPGEHVLRLRTATALSEPVTFWVSPFKPVRESETKQGQNDSPALAQNVPLNSTVEGEIQPSGDAADVDCYRVELRSGQRLSVEVEAIRLGTLIQNAESDLMVRILGPDGKPLGENKDSALFVQDPVLSVIARESGPHFVEIKQQVYTNPRQAFYRAHIGAFSRPLALFPAGGQADTSLDVRILGDPSGERTETVRLPQTPDDFPYFAGSNPNERPPWPNRLRVSPYPNVMASTGVTSVATLPAALNGILDHDTTAVFRFSAKKGETWRVQVFARGLGSPFDPKIWIRQTKSDKNVLEADDAKLTDLGYPSARGTWALPASLDPIALFKPAADGDYEIGIEDSLGRTGPLFVYRIEIEPVHETILTHLSTNEGAPVPRLPGIAVPRGGRRTIEIDLAPGYGSQYKGDLVLEASGLPKGVEMSTGPITKGQTRVPVQFYASPGSESQTRFFQLKARAADGKTSLDSGSHQSVAMLNRGVERPLHVTFLDRYAMAVTDPAPFRIEVEPITAPLVQNGEMAIKAHIYRSPDFKAPVEINIGWLPPNVSKGGAVTVAPDKTEATFTIRAAGNAAPGEYRIALNASTADGDRTTGAGRIRVSSPFLAVTVAEPYMKITLKRSAIEQGQTGTLTAAIDLAKSFPGEAILGLKNLPKGVRLVEPKPKVIAGTKEVVFQIAADSDALAGLYKDVSCDIEVTLDKGASTLHQQAGSGILRVDPARTTTTTGVASR